MLHLRSELSQLEIIMNKELTQAIALEVQIFHSIDLLTIDELPYMLAVKY
jgi:hypothetical protein